MTTPPPPRSPQKGDPGLFGPNSLTWQMHKEPTVLPLAALRTLVLTGGGTWESLRAVVDRQLTIDFSPEAEARNAIRSQSPIEMAAAIDSSVLMYQLTVRPLTDWQQDRYVAERIAVLAVGAEYAGYDDIRAAVTAGPFSPRPTDLIRGAAVPRHWRPVWPALQLLVAGSLPPELRRSLGLEWSGQRERQLEGASRWIKRLRPLVPGRVRILRAARTAEVRIA